MLGTDRPDLDPTNDLSSFVWNDITGETWAQALERFKTFGPLLTCEQALALSTSDDFEVMSFGYGQGEILEGDDVDSFDGITLGELRENLAAGDTLEDLDIEWGPFAVWEVS